MVKKYTSSSSTDRWKDMPSRPLPCPWESTPKTDETPAAASFPKSSSPAGDTEPAFAPTLSALSFTDSPNPFASPAGQVSFGGDSTSPFGASTSPGAAMTPTDSVNPFGSPSPAAESSPFAASSCGDSPFGASSFGSEGGSPFATSDSPNPFNTPVEGGGPLKKGLALGPTALFSSSDSAPFSEKSSSQESTASIESTYATGDADDASSSPFGAVSASFMTSAPTTVTVVPSSESAPPTADGSDRFGAVESSSPGMVGARLPSLDPFAGMPASAGLSTAPAPTKPKSKRGNPFLEMTNHLQQVENTAYSPEQKVMLVAKLMGGNVREEAAALEVTDTLGRIEVCMKAMSATGKKFPPNAGRCLLSACLLENDRRAATQALELLEMVTERSFFAFMWNRQCITCRTQNNVVVPKAEKTSVTRAYWDHLHKLHGHALFAFDETVLSSMSDLRWDWEYGQEPIFIAFATPLYEAVASVMFERLSTSYLLYSKTTVVTNASRSKAAQLVHCLAATGCPSTLDKTLHGHFGATVTALAAPITLHSSPVWTQKFLNGVASCFENSCDRLRHTVTDDHGKTEYLFSAMCQSFLNLTHVMEEQHALPFLDRLLKASPPELEEFIGADHILTGNMRPFVTEPFEQSMCCLATILDQAIAMGFETAVKKIAERFRAGLNQMPRDRLARLLFSAGELSRFGCIEAIVSAVGPSILLHRVGGGGRRVAFQLRGHGQWLLDSFTKMYTDTPEEALEFYRSSNRSCLEDLLHFSWTNPTWLDCGTVRAWVMERIVCLEAQVNTEMLADIEVAHCFAIAQWRKISLAEELLEKHFRQETALLVPSRLVKYLCQGNRNHRAVMEGILIPRLDESFFFKTDNDDKLTPLAIVAREQPDCFSPVLAACPAALSHPLEVAGSALHVLIASRHVTVEIMTDVFDLVEDRDFLEMVDQHGNNVLHVAALSGTSRPVLEMLRSMMPTSVASAKNKAGLTPLEVYHQVGYDRNLPGAEDLSSIFLATSMAKRAM